MDVMTFIADIIRSNEYPTVITDDVFTVVSFNKSASELFKNIAENTCFTEHATVYDRTQLRHSAYPGFTLIGAGRDKYVCAFCPILTGFGKRYVFAVAVPGEDGFSDCETYLTAKLAVLAKCEKCLLDSGVPVCKEKAMTRLHSAVEAELRIAAALGGDNGSSAVRIEKFASDVFDYYCRLRYKKDGAERYDISTDTEYIRICRSHCLLMVDMFDICQKLSENGFSSFGITCRDGRLRMRASVMAKQKLYSAYKKTSDAEEAIYSTLGHEAESLYILKMLARRLNGQAEISLDLTGKEIVIELDMPYEYGKDVLKSRGEDLLAVAYAASDSLFLLRITGAAR